MSINKFLCGLLLALYVASTSSCNKFLDVLPPSQSINPTKIKDFQEMLNSDSLSRVKFYPLDFMCDDVQLTSLQLSNGDNFYRRMYLWEPMIWQPAQDDYMYNSCYTRILQMNIILDKVNAAPLDELNTPENKGNVISQALINRAWYYLQLVNIYGPAYDLNTAGTDVGVPLILVPNSYALQARASVAEIYNSIIADLKRAVNNAYLSSKGFDVIHPGKAAGYALLARAHLYKQDYESASRYADSTLALESTLLNMNTTNYRPNQLLDLIPNKEILMGRLSSDGGFYTAYGTTFMVSQELSDSLGTADKRYTSRFTVDRYTPMIYIGNTVSASIQTFDCSVSVPEAMLIKAECLARANDVNGAAAILTKLRTARLPAASVNNRTYTTGNILYYVLGERRRELCFHGGLRLFDLKRLNRDDRFKRNLVRKRGTETLATLPAGSGLYLIPFSAGVIAANPNIVQNPR